MVSKKKSQKVASILRHLDAAAAAARQRNGSLVVRRFLLDGVKIMKAWRDSLHVAHKVKGGYDEEAIANEIALIDLWMKTARRIAAALRRGSNA